VTDQGSTDQGSIRGGADRAGRVVTLRAVDAENWRAVADVAPRDDQREFAPALAARYLLLTLLEDPWSSLAVYAGDTVVGHAMWAVDDDGSHWIGGVLIDAAEQGSGVGRAAMTALVAWLAAKPACSVVRLSYDERNTAAARLYADLGFVATGEVEGDEVVVERRV
jgi:diamine N-acetyltransferase